METIIMNRQVTLPEIDTETKQRVVNYFDKAKSRGQVLVSTFRDNLPEGITMLKVVSFAPSSGKKEDAIIDNEVVAASVIYRKVGTPELVIAISSQVNKNAQGIPCGTRIEQFMFDGSNVEWLLSLKTV